MLIGVVWSPFRNWATISRVLLRVWPFASARWAARWIGGPSAIGSENGKPTSMRSAPAPGSPCRISRPVA